jgi:tRNA-dihydrouridine synthase A
MYHKSLKNKEKRFSVAPMMDWTDRYCRAFHRVLTLHALLYTEMLTSAALVHGDRMRLLEFDDSEQPVALQLGGSDPAELARAARIGEQYGYREINLNVGCPSDRVQSGTFGACLMAHPQLVASCIAAMQDAVSIPVTVKCRIGIDDQDEDADLDRFMDEVARTGCRTFIIHARKAWLQGLSPKENRDIPPLNYPRVHRIKTRWPELEVVINGGITDMASALDHLDHVDGVMLGRAAYQHPWLLADCDPMFFSADAPVADRFEAVERFLPYIEGQLAGGVYLSRMTRHMMGLFHGQPGGRLWRRHLSEHAHRPDAGIHTVIQALDQVRTCQSQMQAAE